LKDRGLDARIISTQIVKKQGGRAWTGWFRIEISHWLL